MPGHRSVARDRLLAPYSDGAARCHRVPYPFVAALMFAAPVLGAGLGALADWTRAVRERTGPEGRPVAATAQTREVLARASAELRAAHLLSAAAATRADTAGVDPSAVAENVRDVVAAVELCETAVDRLLRASGSRGQSQGDPVQRRRRDVQTAATHAMLRFDTSARSYAETVFGA